MKKLLILILSIAFFSCQSKEEKKPKTIESEKYQTEVFQMDKDNFNIVMLNKFTGNIFVRNTNGNWYNAQALNNSKVYTYPAYSMRLLNGGDNMFQIVLTNTVNGNVYVRSYSSSWYEASGIRELEK